MPGKETKITYNHDVAGIVPRMDRFTLELQRCVSSSTSEFNQFDQTRLATYLSAWSGYIDWVQNQPHLDLPESHPREYNLDNEPEMIDSESEMVNDICRIISVARCELINSQSSRMPARLNQFDEMRLRSIISKLEAFLNTYIAAHTPLDFPESSPAAGMTLPGKTGV